VVGSETAALTPKRTSSNPLESSGANVVTNWVKKPSSRLVKLTSRLSSPLVVIFTVFVAQGIHKRHVRRWWMETR
jgi:hypothetical protein